jgi:L-erythro-3,5-diaminohexanoate dehydrogenase
MQGDPFGSHRVLDPHGSLPQPALRLDNDTSRRFDNEIHVAVRTLNIDAASFRQMEAAAGGDPGGIAELVRKTVRERGKQHNPVTGSGGMLLGAVSWVGPRAEDRGFRVGDDVATLASLSLTPLALDRTIAVRPESAQIDVEGTAVVFYSAPMAKVPSDLPQRLAIALYDVAGAAPQVARLAQPGDLVIVLGAGGKSGLLCAAEARRRVGPAGRVLGVEADAKHAVEVESTGVCDRVLLADARDALALRAVVLDASWGREADVVFSCVNLPGAELSCALITRPRGKVYFFAMSTSFTAAALGAEGVGRDIDMYIGNGYAAGHAEHTLALARSNPALYEVLARRYG